MGKKAQKTLVITCKSDGKSGRAQRFDHSEEAKKSAAANAILNVQAFIDDMGLDIAIHLKNKAGQPLTITRV